MPIREPLTPATLLELAGSLSQEVEALPEPGAGEPGHDLRIVTKSLMRGMLMQSKAFAAVCAAGDPWAAGSNLRSMFELHLDLRFMLRGPAHERLARRLVLYAMKDMADYEPDGNSALTESIESFRRVDPEAVREFEEAWKNNKGHWSGLSRKLLMQAPEPTSTELRRLYKGYSWSAHMVLEPVLGYDWSERGERRREKRFPDAPRIDCTPAAELLRDTWGRVATFFGVVT